MSDPQIFAESLPAELHLCDMEEIGKTDIDLGVMPICAWRYHLTSMREEDLHQQLNAVAHITSLCSPLARADHMVPPNGKGAGKYRVSECWKRDQHLCVHWRCLTFLHNCKDDTVVCRSAFQRLAFSKTGPPLKHPRVTPSLCYHLLAL